MKKITLLFLTFLMSFFSFAQATDVYYIDYSAAKINKLALNGSGTVTEVLDVASSSGAYTAYSTANDKVYWSDFDQALGSNNIWRMNLDGSSPEAVVSSLNDPWGIAIDDTNGKIYWVDSDGTVSRADLDGSSLELGFFSLDDITAIALDVANTRMYLYNYANDTLHSVKMDGTDDQTILTGVYGFSLYVDTVNDKLYFDEQYTDKLMMTDLDGMNPVEINPALGPGVYTYGIEIDYVTNKLYYSGRQAGEIYRSDLDGSNLEVLKTGLTSPRGIFLYDSTLGLEDSVLTGIKIVASNKSIALYNLPQSTNYRVYSITGQSILDGKINGSNHVIDAKTLASGVYIIEIKDANFNAKMQKKIIL